MGKLFKGFMAPKMFGITSLKTTVYHEVANSLTRVTPASYHGSSAFAVLVLLRYRDVVSIVYFLCLVVD